jgi:hypothetical protein
MGVYICMFTCVSPRMFTDVFIIGLIYGGCALAAVGTSECYNYIRDRSYHAQNKKIQ